MLDMEMSVPELQQLIKNTNETILQEPFRVFFTRASTAVQNAAVQRTPVDVGRLRSSIATKIDSSPLPQWAVIGTNVDYAKPVEFGTGLLSEAPDSKHSRYFPPPSALNLWARRHGIPSGFLVARAIYQRGGTKPRSFLRAGLKASEKVIQQYLRAVGVAIGRNWNKK